MDLRMEVDTGASMSIISEQSYHQVFPAGQRPQQQSTRIRLCTYTGEVIKVLGVINVSVNYNSQRATLPLLVVSGDGPSLLGRDWLQTVRLDWKELHHIQAPSSPSLQDILDRHTEAFKDELGTVKGMTAKIHVDEQAQPRFMRPRPVPYALRPKVEMELERLERTGVIEAVQFSDWAAPIVPIIKGDGTVRLCGDYKVTVNQVVKLDTYPLPRIEDLFARLAGGKKFSKLDLANAYLQLQLDDDSKQYVVINTHRGYNRLPFGVSSAPAIFQRTMEACCTASPMFSHTWTTSW